MMIAAAHVHTTKKYGPDRVVGFSPIPAMSMASFAAGSGRLLERVVAGHVGSNIPVTRTPDAHFLAEARYRGTKVVAVSPDYADSVKFADDWLAPRPGTNGALAMAMGHGVLTEFFRDRDVPYFRDYVRRFTDLPFLVTLEDRGDDVDARRLHHDHGSRAGRDG
jgi:nitrate reductase alpha subunit